MALSDTMKYTDQNSIMQEIWKPIADQPLFEVSNFGRIKYLEHRSPRGYRIKERICKQSRNHGYLTVSSLQGSKFGALVHRQVAAAFLSNPDQRPEVNHKDGNKENNHISNLEWSTRSENAQHAHNTGLQEAVRGSDNGQAKLTESDVVQIRNSSETQRVLATRFGVSQNQISKIKRRLLWRHV